MAKSATSIAKATKTASLLLLSLLTIPAIAQQSTPTPTPLPVYDIVSIHPHNTADENISMHIQPSIYAASNVTLKELVSYAYRIREDLISGLPGWADSTHFDITAKISDPDVPALDKLTRQQRETMFQPILADRFRVKVHTEIKTLPVFDLVLTKDGPKFKPSPPPVIDPEHPNKHSFGISINNDELTATSISMADLADHLADELDHTVIDKTGLTGVFDLKLKWTPDRLLNNATDDGSQNLPPSLLTALQEQLGLKLQASKGPVETLVVDHAEKPTPN
jgi:uncharacterized protein (TIGR03435 family)